jgi:TonB family protein
MDIPVTLGAVRLQPQHDVGVKFGDCKARSLPRPVQVSTSDRLSVQEAGSHWPRALRNSRTLGLAILIEAALIVTVILLVARATRTEPAPPPKRIAVEEVALPIPVPAAPKMVRTQVAPPSAVQPDPLSPIAVPTDVAMPGLRHLIPPPSLVPPPAPQTSGVNKASLLARYIAELHAAIQSGLQVPGMVRAMRLSGMATVMFELTPAGHLMWARLSRSSGVPMIDQTALAKVKATQYPPFPAKLPQRDTTFKIKVRLQTNA